MKILPRSPLAAISSVLLFAVFSQPMHATLLWYSPLDGNANATVGTNGIATGSPSAAADRNGNAGSALEFSGSNQYYTLPNYGTFSAGTMSLWAKTDTNAAERGAFCAGASGGGSDQYFSMMNRSGGQVRVDLDDGSSRRDVQSPSAMAIGQWTHIATTWSGNGTMRLFVNGIQVDTQSGLPSSFTMTSPGLIGTERTGERYWDGCLDDAAIWNEELSARKVAAIHGLGKFQGLALNHSAIDTVVGFTTLGQTVTVGSSTWEYVSGLAGSTGTTGGTIVGEDAFIVLDSGSGRGVQISSAPASPPTVVNSAATNIEPTTATAGGNVTDNGGEDPTAILYYGDNDAGTSAGSWDNSINFGTQGGTFSSGLTGLSPSTTYYFRCLATNSGGSDWANSTSSFTTTAPPNPPTVVNNPASNVGFEEGDLNGTVTSTGGEVPDVTIYFGDNDGGTNPGSWDNNVIVFGQSGAFSTEIASLTSDTTYFFRCRATNSGGSSWAPSTESFTTLAFSPPTITNSAAGNVTGASALAGGTVTSTGGDSPAVTLYYGKTDQGTNTGTWENSTSLGVQSGAFSTVLAGLDPDTTYFFRSRAQNAAGTAWASSSLSFTTLDTSELRVNEFMASNDGGTPVPNQVAGATDDWIEIKNTGSGALNLLGWHLTDNPAVPNKWTFPSTPIPAGGFVVVFASSNNTPDANGNLHTNFGLKAGGEYLALVRPSLTVASEFGPAGSNFPSQQTDVSYGVHPVSESAVYFQTPTPGAANDPGGQLLVEDTQFSHKRGYYTAPFSVTITSATAGATIRYTLDGTEPTETSIGSTYSSPIAITTTTILRAAAFKSGLQATNIDSQSYIFPDDVATQVRPSGYPTSWGSEPSADYNVDQNVSLSPQYAARFQTGLRAIPTLSISTDKDEVFGSGGIYSNTTNHSIQSAVSAEYFHPDPALDGVNIEKGFQIDCAFKVQGGASRTVSKSIKHSLSLRFRSAFGAGHLNYDLFDDPGVDRFDSLQLRAMYNNSWIHSDSGQRGRATLIRDQFARQSMIDMGNVDGGRGHYVNLYINGIYWGVHNMHERLENDHYAEYAGLEDTDSVIGYHPGNHTTAEQADYDGMKSVVASGNWTNILTELDVDNYIDYYIAQHFCQNKDLKSNDNWRAAGGGTSNSLWRHYCWDTERTLESVTDFANLGGNDDGGNIINSIDNSLEFRVRFADRAYKHFTNGGVLESPNCNARFQKFVTILDNAIVCESARWGDDRSGGSGPSGDYTRDENWIGATNDVFNTWFPITGASRTSRIITNWKTTNWPGQSNKKLLNIDPAQFSVNGSPQHGGEVPGGDTITAAAPTGSIYYTTDGSDPRLVGGAISGTATLYSSSIPLASSGEVRMRAKNGAEWSAITEAPFYLEVLPGPGDLAVTEIHYHPTDPTALEQQASAEVFTADSFEFIEVENLSASAINLAGVQITDGVVLASADTFALAPGGRAVFVSNLAAFAARYGSTASVAGVFTGSLNNDGEHLVMLTSADATLSDFTYNDAGAWPGRPDGNGSSLEVIDTSGDYNSPDNWRSSCEYNGSPGSAGVGTDGRVVINEVLTHTDLPQTDGIELYNTTAGTIDIGGWVLSDDNGVYQSFSIPSAALAAGSYATFDESQFNVAPTNTVGSYSGTSAASPTNVNEGAHGLSTGDIITIENYGGVSAYNGSWEVTVVNVNNFTIDTPFLDNHATRGQWIPGRPFALSGSKGESLWLLETDGSGKPIKFVDKVDFAASFNGESLGRWPNGGGYDTLIPMTTITSGGNNSGPQIGPVVITEVMYFPEVATEDNFEYIEICNAGTVTENLANWRLRGGADFNFTAAHSLAPGDSMVIVAFDPVAETANANAFRAEYGIDSDIVLVGPFTDGPLGNITGTVRLQRPDSPPAGDPTFYPQVTEDEVIYQDQSPWPIGPAGNGQALDRAGIDLFGNFPSSWTGQLPTPGGKRNSYSNWANQFGLASNSHAGDQDNDLVPNVVEFALGMNPLIDDSSQIPQIIIEGGNATLSYTKNLLLSGITYRVEYSTNLVTWDTAPEVLVSSTNFSEVRKAIAPSAASERVFMKVTIEN